MKLVSCPIPQALYKKYTKSTYKQNIYIYIQVASPIPRGALKQKEVQEEGAVRAGLLQVGLQSFLQRVFASNEAPISHPKRHQETLRMIPQMSQNGPK